MLRPLRLLADDLTGALDSTAAFSTVDAPLPVVWRPEAAAASGSLAFDTGTRELDRSMAIKAVESIAPFVFADRNAVSFKKIDSLLRGSEAEEIGAILSTRSFRCCVIAPAFPGQQRATRGGRQGLVGSDGTFAPLDRDLAAQLESIGHPTVRLVPGESISEGIALFDADTDADLDKIVACMDGDDVLWVGSAGLASALARRFAPSPYPAQTLPPLAAPLLGLFGTEHPVMIRQLDAVPNHIVRFASSDALPQVARRLVQCGVAFVAPDLPPEISRESAASRIRLLFGDLANAIDAPATLLIAGGETLRSLCEVLNVERLDVSGEVLLGIPRSTLVGGRWSSTICISKSGAFGAPDLLRNLIADLPAPILRVPAA